MATPHKSDPTDDQPTSNNDTSLPSNQSTSKKRAANDDADDNNGDQVSTRPSTKKVKLPALQPWERPVSKLNTVKFSNDESGSLRVAHLKFKAPFEGSQPPEVRPSSERSSVYWRQPGPQVAQSTANLQSDTLATGLADLFGLQRIKRYTYRTYEKDCRADPKNVAKTKASHATGTNLDTTKPPVHDINSIFDLICDKSIKSGLLTAIEAIMKQGLRVVTMCSGTESPLLAMNLLNNALVRKGHKGFTVDHLASAEIEPFKQAYIQRNFQPKIIFRDVTEFSEQLDRAHTAFGSWAKQPENVHMLIAGSSCIDYSSLNNEKKEFGQAGQSHETMTGVLDYAKRYRPAIVILENVAGAPWEKIVDKMWTPEGYLCVVVHVDSKDFYIPQTRNRGYMIAFEKNRAKEIGLDLEKATLTAISTIEKLSQRASSPYTDFLFSDDDPELKLARKTLAISEDSTDSAVDWAACRVRYAGYRTQNALGNERPLTLWKNGGKSQFSDYGWMGWARTQRERILDTLDINFLIYFAERHYDMRYKSRFVDLSQNVDRDQDRRQWGIVSCVTPSGMPFDTRRGGPVFGREALALQGIPVEDLSLNEESSRQLQDLAGNAMTTSVIGVMAISAIIASSLDVVNDLKDDKATKISMFKDFGIQSSEVSGPTSRNVLHSKLIEAFETQPQVDSMDEITFQTHHAMLSISELKRLAGRTLPLCGCHNDSDNTERVFYKCLSCGHTACSGCRGNPPHNYENITSRVQTLSRQPTDFINAVTQTIPPALKIATALPMQSFVEQLLKTARDLNDDSIKPDNFLPSGLGAKVSQRYTAAVLSALNSVVYLQSVKHESIWRIIFQSASARLELRFLHGGPTVDAGNKALYPGNMDCIWFLYALPHPTEPAISNVRDLLSRPIAQMKPNGNDLITGKWQFWNPSVKIASLDFRGIGKPQPAWEAKLGLQKEIFRTLETFPKLKVSEGIAGNHQLDSHARQILHGICGEYEWLEGCGSACGSLFKQVPPMTDQNPPVYLFLESKPLQNAFLDRMSFAHTHDRLAYGLNRQIIADVSKGWRPNTLTLKGNTLSAKNVPCRLIDYWHDDISIKLSSNVSRQDMTIWTPKKIEVDTSDCAQNIPLLIKKLGTDEVGHNYWTSGNSYVVNLIDKSTALKEHQWSLKHIGRLISHAPNSITSLDDSGVCQNCAPQVPALKWCYTGKMKKKAVIRPFEDPEEAAHYESSLINRPTPITAEVYVRNTHIWLVISLNLATLVHRLCGRLNISGQPHEISWRMLESDAHDAPPLFPKLTANTNASLHMWPAGDILYQNDQIAIKPRMFDQRTLWPSQRRALAWMLSVEQGLLWRIWDAESFDAPALNMQLFVEAKKEENIYGGIVADEVGAGKTTTALALIARGLEAQTQSSVVKGAQTSKRIKSAATLILVPGNILGQWRDEIHACFGSPGPNVIEISKKADQTTIEAIKNADIILAPWEIFLQDEYWKMLSNVCCAPNTPKKVNRAFKQWLDEAILDLEGIATECSPAFNLNTFKRHRKDRKDDRKAKYTAFAAFTDANEQGTRLKELTKAASNLKTGVFTPDAVDNDKKLFDKEFERLLQWQPKKQIPALLHFFRFARIIVDEFTYFDARALLAVQKLDADHKWMLSGTPPMADSESVNSMAALIGTSISSDIDTKFYFSFKDARSISAAERSYAEEFRDKIIKRSPAQIRGRYERTTAFVQTFVRQNPAPAAIVSKIEKYVVLPPTPLEAYIFNDVFQRITGQPLRFGLKKAAGAQDSGEEAKLRKLQGAKTPEEALLSCHAYFLSDFVKKYGYLTDQQVCARLARDLEGIVNGLYLQVAQHLQQAYWFWNEGPASIDKAEDNNHLTTYLDCVLRSAFGDPSASDILSCLAVYARDNAPQQPMTMVSSKKEEEFDEHKTYSIALRRKELQHRVTELNDKTLSFVERVQQLRLLQQVSSIVQAGTTRSCDNCQQGTAIGELKLLGQCGHLICNNCLDQPSARSWDINGCPVDRCSTSSKEFRTPATTYVSSGTARTPLLGSKMEAIVQTILSLDPADRVLVFVQFDAHRDQLSAALSMNFIPFVDGTVRPETTIAAFQKGEDQTQTVLILRLDSADSAGWNLQIANHVMFVAPFLARTQYDYEATMTQAVGRCFRFGQKKGVVVYHFIMAGTMDVNVTQGRSKKRLVQGQNGEYYLADLGSAAAQGQEDISGPSLDGLLVEEEEGVEQA